MPTEFDDVLTNQPVVIDNVSLSSQRMYWPISQLNSLARCHHLLQGSGTLKAGFAGSSLPTCYFPSCVGRPKHERCMAGAVEGDIFIGRRAQELRGLLKVKYPVEHGIITDWEDMERIWAWTYSEELRTLSEEVSKRLIPIKLLDERSNNANILSALFSLSIPCYSQRHPSIRVQTAKLQLKYSLRLSMFQLSSQAYRQF